MKQFLTINENTIAISNIKKINCRQSLEENKAILEIDFFDSTNEIIIGDDLLVNELFYLINYYIKSVDVYAEAEKLSIENYGEYDDESVGGNK